MRNLISVSVVAILAFALGGCEGPVSQLHGPDANPSVRQGQACEAVKGNGFIQGPVPQPAPRTASGTVSGDLAGEVEATRTGGDRKGEAGTTFLFHSWEWNTNRHGLFEGESNMAINLSRTDAAQIHLDITGPGDEDGFVKMNGRFTFMPPEFDEQGNLVEPGTLRFDFRYRGRICG